MNSLSFSMNDRFSRTSKTLDLLNEFTTTAFILDIFHLNFGGTWSSTSNKDSISLLEKATDYIKSAKTIDLFMLEKIKNLMDYYAKLVQSLLKYTLCEY